MRATGFLTSIIGRVPRDTVRGLAPAAAFLLALFVVQKHYSYLRTSIDRTVAGLETGTMYVVKYGSNACVGDTVLYRSRDRKGYRHYRRIAARAGQTVSLSETGYVIDGNAQVTDDTWVAKANAEFAKENKSITIPKGELLVINSQFDPKTKGNNWTYEIFPRGRIKSRVTHILLSRDVSRIGEPVGSAGRNCLVSG